MQFRHSWNFGQLCCIAQSTGPYDTRMPLSAPSPRTVTGILLAAASTTIGGAKAVVTRFVIEQSDPLTLAASRSVIGGATLAAIVFA